MFREMRRFKQKMDESEVLNILTNSSNGILACYGDEGYPYAVPLNYVYCNGKIYFHSAKEGHKIDAIINNSKVSFAIVAEDLIKSAEFTSYFRSVIVFGKARLIEGEEWQKAFWALVEKYSSDMPHEAKHNEIEGCKSSYILAIEIEHMTGKKAIELI